MAAIEVLSPFALNVVVTRCFECLMVEIHFGSRA